ncbi:hypothetical protein AVEN_83066-1 [Araneus ventricosus]|uniref:Uncharacterized protein n=1 Tax=Araneus ventricosus TaxID=182803 RepID=A0A4Y2AMB7_ARAVE|nr:hypothetical protein AVEN_83066-1 [Araneus ventricosus]
MTSFITKIIYLHPVFNKIRQEKTVCPPVPMYEFKAGNSSVLHSIYLSQHCVFSTHSSRKVRQVIHSAFQSTISPVLDPHYFLPTQRNSDYVDSKRDPTLGKRVDLPLPSNKGPALESAHELP